MTDYAEDDEILPGAPRPPQGLIGPQMLLGGIIGAAIGATLARIKHRLSEEPPIRVKRGSTEFEILSADIIWVPDGGSGRKWRLSAGDKRSDRYTVRITTKGGTSSHGGKLLRFYLNEHTWVTLNSNGRKTTLMSPQYDLALSGDQRTLTHPLSVDRIQIDSRVPYFARDAELIEVWVYDE